MRTKQYRWFLVMCLVLAASAVAAAETTIVFWHWDRADRHEKIRPLIDRFEEETGIRVEAQMYPWAELAEKLIVGVAGGVAPDVVAVSFDRSAPLVFQGIYTDLRPFIEKETEYDFDDLLPNALELWRTADGMQFAFPYDLDLIGLFYNKTIFDTAGIPYPDESTTWAQTLEWARRFTVDRNGDGLPDQYGIANGHIALDTFVWAFGGELVTSDLRTHALGTPEARMGLEMWHDISQPDANMAWGDATRFGYPHPPAAFAGGLIAMYPIGAYAPSAFWRDPDTGEWFVDFDMTLVPMGADSLRALPMNGQGMAIVSSSQNKEAAWEFIKFLASHDVQVVSGRDLGQFPVLRSVAVSDAFIVPGEPPANKIAAVQSSMYARFHPVLPNWDRAWQTMRTTIAQYVNNAMSLSNAIQTLDEVIPAILNP